MKGTAFLTSQKRAESKTKSDKFLTENTGYHGPAWMDQLESSAGCAMKNQLGAEPADTSLSSYGLWANSMLFTEILTKKADTEKPEVASRDLKLGGGKGGTRVGSHAEAGRQGKLSSQGLVPESF